MAAAALILSILALAASLGTWLVDKRARDSDRVERRQERDQDRTERSTEREQDRRERHAERNDVLLDVALVELPAAGRSDGIAESWWRLRLIGGNAFSRATVAKLEFCVLPNQWEPVVQPDRWGTSDGKSTVPFTLGGRQDRFFRANVLATSVRVEWSPDGEPTRSFEQRVFEQPG